MKYQKIYLACQLFGILFSTHLVASNQALLSALENQDSGLETCSHSCSWGKGKRLRHISLGTESDDESISSSHDMGGTESDDESCDTSCNGIRRTTAYSHDASDSNQQNSMDVKFWVAFENFKPLVARLSKNPYGYKLDVGTRASLDFQDFLSNIEKLLRVRIQIDGNEKPQDLHSAEDFSTLLQNLQGLYKSIVSDPVVLSILKIKDQVMEKLMENLDLLMQYSRRHVNSLLQEADSKSS